MVNFVQLNMNIQQFHSQQDYVTVKKSIEKRKGILAREGISNKRRGDKMKTTSSFLDLPQSGSKTTAKAKSNPDSKGSTKENNNKPTVKAKADTKSKTSGNSSKKNTSEEQIPTTKGSSQTARAFYYISKIPIRTLITNIKISP